MTSIETRALARAAALFALVVLVACQVPATDVTLPTPADVRSAYASGSAVAAEIRGNVAVIWVTQSDDQLRRGGTLWAKVGPYVFLFTEETHRLFETYPGLAGVRVVTRTGSGTEVANALLVRDELSGVLWRRSLNIAGQARRDGSQRLTLLEDLVRWGEDHTEFAYNERYTRRR